MWGSGKSRWPCGRCSALDLNHLSCARIIALLLHQITESERCGIKHHLLDIKEPGDDFSAGIFHDLAWEAVDQIVKVSACLEALEQWHSMSGVIMKQGRVLRLRNGQCHTTLAAGRQDAHSGGGHRALPRLVCEGQAWDAGLHPRHGSRRAAPIARGGFVAVERSGVPSPDPFAHGALVKVWVHPTFSILCACASSLGRSWKEAFRRGARPRPRLPGRPAAT